MRLILARPLHRAFYFVCAVLVLGLIFSTGGAGASGASNPSANPEQMLADIVQDMSSNHLKQAQAKADALVTAYPGFRLGHLIRGDLLLMRTRPVAQLGAAANGAHDSLKDLRDEAGVRLLATRMPQGDDRLPLAILTLRKDQKHALLVDARHSRIYLYAHRDGQLTLLRDFYMSQGKYGLNKAREGDSRTPQGVYRIIRRLPGAKLPDFYGEGALPLNYPNEWDKINGRSGSGIWIHGTPSDLYSRPPRATDGCVVLSNEDLRVLTTLIETVRS